MLVLSSQRQKKRNQQRGQLNRSVLLIIILITICSVTLVQWKNISLAFRVFQDNIILWTATKGFTIQNLQVVGRVQVSPQDLMTALGVDKGMPILSYNPQLALDRLQQNPWFKTVNIERRLPDTIFVRVTERIPAARWQIKGKLAIVDVDGIVLTDRNMALYKDLPIIIGQEAPQKIKDLFLLLKGEPLLTQQLSAATWISNRRWNLTLRNNIVIKLPAKDPELALSRFVSYNQKEKVLERDIKLIDLRIPKQIILQPTVRANTLIERPDFSDTKIKNKQEI